jgi:hypothetical protein
MSVPTLRAVSQPDPRQDVFARLGVSPSLRAIIERSALEKERTGDWVSLDTLAHEAAARGQPVSAADEVFRLPGLLGHAASGEKIALTALGLVASGSAPRLSVQLARLAALCAQRRYEHKESAEISRQILVEEYSFGTDEAAEACDLVQLIPGLTAGGQTGDDWRLTIFRGALDYLRVEDVDGLLRVLEAEADRRVEAGREAAARSAILYERTDTAPSPPSPAQELVFLSWGRRRQPSSGDGTPRHPSPKAAIGRGLPFDDEHRPRRRPAPQDARRGSPQVQRPRRRAHGRSGGAPLGSMGDRDGVGARSTDHPNLHRRQTG